MHFSGKVGCLTSAQRGFLRGVAIADGLGVALAGGARSHRHEARRQMRVCAAAWSPIRSPGRALVMSNGNNGEITVNSVRDVLLTICNPRLRTLRVLASSNIGQDLERAMKPVALALLLRQRLIVTRITGIASASLH
jgi:hypothetical protein